MNKQNDSDIYDVTVSHVAEWRQFLDADLVCDALGVVHLKLKAQFAVLLSSNYRPGLCHRRTEIDTISRQSSGENKCEPVQHFRVSVVLVTRERTTSTHVRRNLVLERLLGNYCY